MLKFIEVPPLGEQKQTETLLNFWYLKEGETFKSGDDVLELVTDKAAFNLPASEPGKLLKILVREGETVAVGQKLAEYDAA